MPQSEPIALVGFAVAAVAMLFVAQTKERVDWPAWLVPAVAVVPLAAWTGFAAAEEGPLGFWTMLMGSSWGLQVWLDRLMTLTAAFYLLQNRARAAGMRSEVWVIVVIFTGSIGMLLMLAQTAYLERRIAVSQEPG